MCDIAEAPPPKLVHDSTDDVCKKVSQGTQVTWRPKPPLIRQHASEMLLSPRRAPNTNMRNMTNQSTFNSAATFNSQIPFYTTRSGHPYDTIYGTYANRVRRRPQPYMYPTDSPTSSLDCLPIRTNDWNTEPTINSMKVNGTPGSGASLRSCKCLCHGAVGTEGGPPDNSAETLSWRRLHMSRAKLKATATTSELLSGFAMIAMVELQINEPTNVPEWLFVMFAVCTTVLVAVHIFALMISTYLLPNIDAASKISDGDVLRDSPHERMRGFIELAWAFSTVLGLFLFLVEIAILCWVKFWDYSFAAATAATVIVIPVLIVFVAFAIHFYHSLVVHKYEASNGDIEQLENMKRNLDSATITANSPV